MARTPLILPDCLANWIDKEMPELHGVRKVSFFCCDDGDIPFDFLSLFSGLLKQRRGFTLWSTVYLRRDTSGCCPLNPCDLRGVWLILHELQHVVSFLQSPILFPIQYLIRLMYYGYDSHPDEVAANNRADALRDLYDREDPCHCHAPVAVPGPAAPRILTPAEIEGCCGSLQNQDPNVQFSDTETSRAGGKEITVVITARQTCGIRSLSVRPFITSGGVDAPLPKQMSPGADCLSFRSLTVKQFVQSGASLKIVADAVSCCGKSSSRTAVFG